jgi:hypothetical protein
MDFIINIDLKKLPKQISYRDKILLMGSCFTEHIGGSLEELKFSVLQNPNGILFDPLSVSKSLLSYAHNKQYKELDLFQLNELWHSWQHHSKFSNINKEECLRNINKSQTKAHEFLKDSDWIIITLGSAFSYRLTKESSKVSPAGGDLEGAGVANCHRAPAQWFTKQLLEIENMISVFEDCLKELLQFNPKLKFIFTVSPVRHIRDGVVDNNRSKARLIEVTHDLVNKYEQVYYFPAYELVIDVLRDHRFYDVDLVHPNYAATEFVLDKFTETCIDDESKNLMQEIRPIVIAAKHKAFQPETNAHKQFLQTHFEKAKDLQDRYPFIDLSKELEYFSQKVETR